MGSVALPVRVRARGSGPPARSGPARTSSPALTAQRTSKRSENVTDQNRPVSATARSIVVELVEGDAARLVGHHVLAVAQRLDGDRTPPVGHRRGDDQVDPVLRINFSRDPQWRYVGIRSHIVPATAADGSSVAIPANVAPAAMRPAT